jgi:predicted aspartyl protease
VIWAEVDTGAAVSVAPQGLARDLGITPGTGRRVNLIGVGRARVGSTVYLLDLQIAGLVFTAVPVAIMDDDTVPFLLGRLGLFSSATITLDAGSKSVNVSPVPLFQRSQ